MTTLQKLAMCPEMVDGPTEWLGNKWGEHEYMRPSADSDAVDVGITHFDGTYVYETRVFNRYRIRVSDELSKTEDGPRQTRSWEERSGSRCVTVTETYHAVTKHTAKVYSRYVEVWLYDKAVKDHYDRLVSVQGATALGVGDTSAAAVAYGATLVNANPATTVLGATFATFFAIGTASYGYLTDWGGKVMSKDWVDYGYCVVTTKSEKRDSIYRSEPHPCGQSEAEKREEEHRKAQREYDEAERERKIQEERKKGVQWVGGTTGGESSGGTDSAPSTGAGGGSAGTKEADPETEEQEEEQDEESSGDEKEDSGRPTILIAGAIAGLLAAAGIFLAVRDDGGPTTPTAVSGTTAPPSASPSSTARVSGPYAGSVAVDEDPAGHACCVKPAMQWEVLQTRNTMTGAITMALNDVLEGIDLRAPLVATGATFTADGMGSVAGHPGTSVSFTGTVTPEQGVRGMLTVGANGTLPTGRPITFRVDLRMVP